MTSQELFDRVSLHLLTQNKVSVNTIGICAYRGDGGLMCAIGCLIPDDIYGTWMDFGDQLYRVLCDIGLIDHFNLCARLQGIHDKNPVDKWPTKLRALAEEFGLKYEHE